MKKLEQSKRIPRRSKRTMLAVAAQNSYIIHRMGLFHKSLKRKLLKLIVELLTQITKISNAKYVGKKLLLKKTHF
jgi:hypothetical protein